MSDEPSPAPWTWINSESPEALEWARVALAHLRCHAVILSRNFNDGAFVRVALADPRMRAHWKAFVAEAERLVPAVPQADGDGR